ncbi:lipid phosphate phosphatase epsilon 1, chloroplastic-like [Cornus florida]|uniref:lipid phosphate phosphatase epsilon 1, chloroplastic-like n=1 Tax=Cornus florida TaxID=4283 RepID=UPI00289AF667|nr:lipid phosphate phosphatase epsilon 1, chloroplastic-like [Cornus florida]
MSTATALVCKPTTTTTITSFPKLKYLKRVSYTKIPISKLVLCGQSLSQKPVSVDNRCWRPNTMTESTQTSAFKSSNGDGVVRPFEQEALIRRSSDFRPNFMACGLESILNSLSKWFVAALFGAVFLWRHDAEALWAATGSVLNAGLSVALKHILNQERPIPTSRSDPGMPSSHAQSIFFTNIFVIKSMMDWLGVNGYTVTLSVLLLALGSYFSWLRVSQKLHTMNQIVVGATLGSIFSILWFWLWDEIVLKAFISHLWVRLVVILGGSGFCLCFILYVIRFWFNDDR